MCVITQDRSSYRCPRCDALVYRRKTPDGFYWGCSGFLDGCGLLFSDVQGKPNFELVVDETGATITPAP